MFKIYVNRFSKLFLLVLLIVSGCLSATAQDGTATLRGTVTDPNGAVVPAATISVANEETGINRRNHPQKRSGLRSGDNAVRFDSFYADSRLVCRFDFGNSAVGNCRRNCFGSNYRIFPILQNYFANFQKSKVKIFDFQVKSKKVKVKS